MWRSVTRYDKPLPLPKQFYLLLEIAFSLGYRRVEWKCNALNAVSKRAAQRLAFYYEGIWRSATVIRGRRRDTAWFAMTDQDWKNIKPCYRNWLHKSNFSAKEQKTSLSDITKHYLNTFSM